MAEALGCEAPFVRPGTSQDDTPGMDPVIHAITLFVL